MKKYVIPSILLILIILGIGLLLIPNHDSIVMNGTPTRIWAVDDGEKIEQSNLRNYLSNNNSVWDGKTIRLFGGRNEIVAFQIIIESANTSAKDITVVLNSLSKGSSIIKNDEISKGDPYDYRGKRIELFKEQYYPIINRSKVWMGSSIAPNYTGMIPDALIPFEASKSAGGAPFDIDAGKLQGVWIDITIPRDASPGEYVGEIKVTESNNIIKIIPIQLRVYSFTLPDENHFKNFFISDTRSLENKHDAKFRRGDTIGNKTFTGDIIEDRYFQMFHRHRINLNMNTLLDGIQNYYGKFIIGTGYSYENKYDGPGTGIGHNVYSIGTYDMPKWVCVSSGFCNDTKEGYWEVANNWTRWFKQNAPKTYYFKYMIDEPDWGKNSPNGTKNVTWNYNYIIEHANWINTNPGIGKEMHVFASSKIDRRLIGYIDTWGTNGNSGWMQTSGQEASPDPQGYIISSANQRRALGELIGIYNSHRPSYPAIEFIDNDATDPRAIMWIAKKYDVDFYFLWHTTYWNTFLPPRDVFTESIGYANGGGEFIYPGEQKNVNTNDKGLAGPIASIRMKNFRRGMQDYEYFWLAEQKGINIRRYIDNVIYRAFDDFGHTPIGNYTNAWSTVPWSVRSIDYERQRRNIAEMLG